MVVTLMVNIISEISKEKIFDLLNKGKRVDHRSFTEYRDIHIKTNYIGKSEGSAKVSIGKTTVVAGVKAQITTPFNNTPDQGILITNTELLPIANRNFEYGPPNKFAVEISRVVDRTIRESPLVDLKKLCIVEGSKVWKLHIDIYIVDFDGNIMDAACLGAVATLLTTKIPTATSVNGEITLDEDNLTTLPISNKSILCTVVKVNNQLIVDATYAEENLMDAGISIGFREDGSICAIQKSGLNILTVDEVLRSKKIAEIRSRELFSVINKIKS